MPNTRDIVTVHVRHVPNFVSSNFSWNLNHIESKDMILVRHRKTCYKRLKNQTNHLTWGLKSTTNNRKHWIMNQVVLDRCLIFPLSFHLKLEPHWDNANDFGPAHQQHKNPVTIGRRLKNQGIHLTRDLRFAANHREHWIRLYSKKMYQAFLMWFLLKLKSHWDICQDRSEAQKRPVTTKVWIIKAFTWSETPVQLPNTGNFVLDYKKCAQLCFMWFLLKLKSHCDIGNEFDQAQGTWKPCDHGFKNKNIPNLTWGPHHPLQSQETLTLAGSYWDSNHIEITGII